MGPVYFVYTEPHLMLIAVEVLVGHRKDYLFLNQRFDHNADLFAVTLQMLNPRMHYHKTVISLMLIST